MGNQPQHRRSTENYGLGQSGIAAGRREGDPALEKTIETRNVSYPRGLDEHVLEWGDDERWTGRGGLPWVPPTDEPNADAASGDEPEAAAQKVEHPWDAARPKRSVLG